MQSMSEKVAEEVFDLRGEAAAEYLSEVSYGDAYKGYAHSGGDFLALASF